MFKKVKNKVVIQEANKIIIKLTYVENEIFNFVFKIKTY